MNTPPLLAIVGLLLAGLTLPGVARACATCACGDPTIFAMGAERPVPGQVRLSVIGGWRGEQTPAPIGDLARRTDEFRFDLTAAGTIGRRLWLSGTLPILSRGLREPNLSSARSMGWGDAELRARVVLYADAGPTPVHHFGLSGGLIAPTALRVREAGEWASDDLQPGTGALSPLLGLWHLWQRGLWSGFSSLTGRVSAFGFEQRTPGPVGLASTALQIQPIPELAPRLQLDARLSATNQLAGEPEGIGGGFLFAVSPGLLVSPVRSVAIYAEVRIPVFQQLEAGARETAQPVVGVAFDL